MGTNDFEMEKYWLRAYGGRFPDHPVVQFFANQRVAEISGVLPFNSVRNALDVGCGSGFSTVTMGGLIPTVFGLDSSKELLLRHSNHLHCTLVRGDAQHLPFPDNSFDLAYGWECLHHLSEPVLGIKEMARVSRRYVLVAEPNPRNPVQFLFALIDSEHRATLGFRHNAMLRMFKENGLSVTHAWQGGWIFPNKTPRCLLPFLRRIPYRCRLGITNWVLGEKNETGSL